MNAYEQALADFEKAEKEREEARKRLEQAMVEQKRASIAEIKAMMVRFGIALEDLGSTAGKNAANASGRKERSDKGKAIAPKYRDPVSGKTWTGRGNPPVWIKDAKAAGNLGAYEIR